MNAVQDALFGTFGEVQTDIFDAVAEARAESSTMHRHGYASGHEDALDGEWSAPMPAEDGADYTAGYLAGHADGLAALAQHRADTVTL